MQRNALHSTVIGEELSYRILKHINAFLSRNLMFQILMHAGDVIQRKLTTRSVTATC
jgi:hypothetical protein